MVAECLGHVALLYPDKALPLLQQQSQVRGQDAHDNPTPKRRRTVRACRAPCSPLPSTPVHIFDLGTVHNCHHFGSHTRKKHVSPSRLSSFTINTCGVLPLCPHLVVHRVLAIPCYYITADPCVAKAVFGVLLTCKWCRSAMAYNCCTTFVPMFKLIHMLQALLPTVMAQVCAAPLCSMLSCAYCCISSLSQYLTR